MNGIVEAAPSDRVSAAADDDDRAGLVTSPAAIRLESTMQSLEDDEEEPRPATVERSEPRRGKPWLRWQKTLPNTGSTARDHLANERTFLAWLHTGLANLALGLAFARFAGPSVLGLLAGGLFVSLGAIFIAFSGVRYFQVKRRLQNEEFSVMAGGVLLMLILTILVAAACTVIMLLWLLNPESSNVAGSF